LQFVLPSLPSISSLPPVPFDPTHQQTLEWEIWIQQWDLDAISIIYPIFVVGSRCMFFSWYFSYELQIRFSSIYLLSHVASYHQLETSTL
jgi:hypothetical protein